MQILESEQIEIIETIGYPIYNLLANWADFQHTEKMRLGYDSKSAVFSSGGIHSVSDWEDSQEVEKWNSVDGAFESLCSRSHVHKAAIMQFYGLSGAVFRFPRGGYKQAVIDAHDMFAGLLRMHNVVF